MSNIVKSNIVSEDNLKYGAIPSVPRLAVSTQSNMPKPETHYTLWRGGHILKYREVGRI